MAGFSTIQGIRDQILAGKSITADYGFNGPAGATYPCWQSPWYLWDTKIGGASPTAGAAPAAGSGTPGAGGTAYTNATGGIFFPDTTGKKFLLSWSCGGTDQSAASVMLIDRLCAVGSIAVNSTGVKDVGSPTLPRYATTESYSNQVWAEVDTAGTTTAVQINLNSYTDQDGNTGASSGTITFNSATATKGTFQGPFPLAAGDTGVRSVESVNVTVAGSGSGVINIVIVRPLALFPFGDNGSLGNNLHPSNREFPFPYLHPIRIFDGATLQVIRAGSSSNSRVEGSVTVIEAP